MVTPTMQAEQLLAQIFYERKLGSHKMEQPAMNDIINENKIIGLKVKKLHYTLFPEWRTFFQKGYRVFSSTITKT